MEVEVFADTGCPFTHIVLRRLVVRGLRLRVRAWPLELVDGEPMSASLVAEEVAALRNQVEPSLFARFVESRFPATSLPALALAAAAYEAGLDAGERVSLALRDALFEDGRDLADPAVLAAIAAAHGVDQPSARHDAIVRSDWEEGRRRGVEGSPQVFAGGGSWFCPGLDVQRDGDGFHISADDAALDEVVAAAR